jgi:RNA polymerase sigma-70 factor (ECF subfamily)
MNPEAFESFYADTSQQLLTYLLRICNDRETAEDILQESYLRFLQKPPVGRAPEQKKSYLYTIATRLNLDRIKQTKRRQTNLQTLLSQKEIMEHENQMQGSLHIDMTSVFNRLKTRERALLWLAYVEEQPHRAIAEILAVREESVKVLLFRARGKLAKILKKYKIDDEVIL